MKLSSALCNFCLATAALLFFVVLPTTANALTTQTVVSYTFSGVTGAPAATAAGVSGSEFIRDNSADTFYDNTAGRPAPDTNSNGWATAGTPDLSLYYTFTITPAAGGTSWNGLTLDVADFDAAHINDGPTRFAVRSSLDGFTANLLTGSVGTAFTTASAALSVTSSVPVEYRIYGFGAGTAQGLFQVDNVALTFAPPVPEPSELTMLGLASLAYLAATRRRV